MSVITPGSLLIDSWGILSTIIKDKVSDIGDSRSGSEFVVSAWPNRTDYPRSKWLGYPFVVLQNEMDSESNLTINRGLKVKKVSFHADVYNKSKDNTDRMANQINEILDISEDGLIGSGLINYRVESSSYSPDTDPSGSFLHKYTLNWAYDYIANK